MSLWKRLKKLTEKVEPYDPAFADPVEQAYRENGYVLAAPFTGEEQQAFQALDESGKCCCDVCRAGRFTIGLRLKLVLVDVAELWSAPARFAPLYLVPEELNR